MASSSNVESEYSLPDIPDWNNEYKKEILECPLCSNFAKNFYCVDCVRNGNFILSRKACIERHYLFNDFLARFADKKPKMYELEEEKKSLLERYKERLARKIEMENLRVEIGRCREKIQILKKTIHATKPELLKVPKVIKRLEIKKDASLERQEVLFEKLRKLRESHKLENDRLVIAESNLNTRQCALQSVINSHIRVLATHLLPITKVVPENYREKDQYADLEEAQKTTYVQGQWVITESPMDRVKYRIADTCCLPSTGDYSAYLSWCSTPSFQSGEILPGDRAIFDAGYGISTALLYCAQISNILAFYMDVHLPKRSNMSDFTNTVESNEKFQYNVAKLNANIISLCVSQNVDVSKLSAHRTVSNLLLLLNSRTNNARSAGHLQSTPNFSRLKNVISFTTSPVTERYRSLEEQEEILESLEDSIFKDIPEIVESDNDNSEYDFVILGDADMCKVPEKLVNMWKGEIKDSSLKSDTENRDIDFEFVLDEDIAGLPEVEPIAKPAESLYTSMVSFWKNATGQK